MLFNSFHFAAFFAVVYSGYLLLQGRLRAQNTWLLVASYYFYGSWDLRFLALLCLTTLLDWFVALRIDASEGATRRRWLMMSLSANLGVLGFFKYFNFFTESAVDLLQAFSLPISHTTLQIVLPVGVSFYTFQSISYTVEVYRGRLAPTRNLADFALFVAFFPQLVAGPIERATRLLPQVLQPRRIELPQCEAGCFLIVWGLFKKLVIADNLAVIANPIFDRPTDFAGMDLWVAALAFTFQIYCDFSGYTDIARGVAKLMGFDLMLNFRLPYFSRSPSEFWQRWHVSLSQWLRDYVYIPLGGNRAGELRTARNLVLTMLLGGLWHGAAWNFVLWGAYHGLLLVAYRPFERRPEADGYWRVPLDALRMAAMFGFTVFGWILFRATSLEHIVHIVQHLDFSFHDGTSERLTEVLSFVAPLLLVELAQLAKNDLLALARLPAVARGVVYAVLISGMLLFAPRESMEFIYFQF